MAIPSLRLAKWHELGAVIALVAATAGIGQTGIGHAALQKVGLLGPPPNYTSLSFLHPQSLPEQVTTARTNVDASFIIHNMASSPNNYHWEVFLFQGKRERRLDQGSIAVGPEHIAVLTQHVDITCASGKVRVVVRLTHPAEYISAWAVCSSRRS